MKTKEKPENTILVVDDNSANLELLREILSKDGYLIKLARGGKEALQKISDSMPSLILLDVMMPGMDGYDLCSILKSNDETKNIPIIFISALEDDESKIRGLQAGAIDFITKPFIHKEVSVRVKNYIEIRNLQTELEGLNKQLKDEINEKQLNEKLLRESNDKFSKAFTVSPFVQIITTKEDGKIIEVNEAIHSVGGFSREEAIGKTTFELNFWLNVATRNEFIRKLATEGKVLNYEVSLRRKNGIIFDALISGEFIVIDEKDCVLSVVQDISEIKNAHASIKESEQLFSYMFYKSPATITITSPFDGMIYDVNETFLRDMEYKRDEVIGKTTVELGIFDDLNDRKRLIEILKKDNHVYGYECTFRTKTGKKIHGLVSIVFINQRGKMLQLTTVIDISSRINAEKALVESEKKYKDLAENMKDVIWILDANTQKFLYVSPSVYELRGYSPEEVMSQSVEAALTPESAKEFNEKFGERINGFLSGLYTNRHHIDIVSQPCKNGNIVVTEVTTSYFLNPTNGHIEITGVSRDITQKKAAEQALEESRKNLMALNNTKDKLFSIIAHDLKSPFNSIMGFSELLKNNIHTLEPGKIEEYLDHIYDSSKKTFILIDNLLIWAKSQAGKIEFKPQQTDIEKIFQEITVETESQSRIKNISINYFQSEKIFLNADINMTRTILRNLIVNAIKFTRPGGKIHLFAMRKDKMAEITVSDNGIGMKRETADNLFNSHPNESTAGTANEKGSGLGLQICKEFVERHCGVIWAESEPGSGTEIKFLLPLHK